jgi:hypothetical protein
MMKLVVKHVMIQWKLKGENDWCFDGKLVGLAGHLINLLQIEGEI